MLTVNGLWIKIEAQNFSSQVLSKHFQKLKKKRKRPFLSQGHFKSYHANYWEFISSVFMKSDYLKSFHFLGQLNSTFPDPGNILMIFSLNVNWVRNLEIMVSLLNGSKILNPIPSLLNGARNTEPFSFSVEWGQKF